MLGHKTPRDMLIARLAIARKREAAMRQLHAIDAEARPYDEAIGEMLEEGRDVHLEYMDPVDKRFRKFTVRRTSWGEVEFSRAESVRDLRFPIEPAPPSPPVADAVADSPSDDDIDAVLDPKGNVRVEIEREARRTREAIVRDGLAAIPPELDPVAGLGSLLRETRYGEPRIPTIRDGKTVGALEALASIRSALRSGDPITEAAVYAAMEDDGGFPVPDYSDDETVIPDEDHAVVEHQAAS